MHTTCPACYHQLGHGEGLPAQPPQALEENEDFLKKAHHVLLEVGGVCNPLPHCVVGVALQLGGCHATDVSD